MIITNGNDYLTLDVVKTHMGVTHNNDDMMIQAYTVLSLDYLRARLNSRITEDIYKFSDDDFIDEHIFLPEKPYKCVVTFDDGNGAQPKQTELHLSELHNSLFTVPTVGGVVGDVLPVAISVYSFMNLFYDKLYRNKEIQITRERFFEVIYNHKNNAKGWVDVEIMIGTNAPLINQARLLLINDWYFNREDTQYYKANTINHGVDSIVSMLQSGTL